LSVGCPTAIREQVNPGTRLALSGTRKAQDCVRALGELRMLMKNIESTKSPLHIPMPGMNLTCQPPLHDVEKILLLHHDCHQGKVEVAAKLEDFSALPLIA